MNKTWYEIYLNDVLIDTETLAGIATIKYNSVKLLGQARLEKHCDEDDPVLGHTFVYVDSIGAFHEI